MDLSSITIDDIMTRSKQTGHKFFEPEALKFFRSRVSSEVYTGPGGIFFVTSEQFVGSDGHAEPRKYTPRKFVWEDGTIAHFPGEPEFNTCSRAKAHRIAKEAAQRAVSHLEHAAAVGIKTCNAQHIAPGGHCLNCGWTPHK